MTITVSIRRGFSLLASGVLALAAACAAEVAPADLEATVRTFDFVETLPHRSVVAVGVVYRGGDAVSKSAALRAAAVLTGAAGSRAAVVAAPIAVNELEQDGRHVDVVYVMPGVSEAIKPVADYIRNHRILAVSSDPACLTAQCCVLMVRAGGRTEIVLDTVAARETGTTFSPVFMMMVKRK